MTSYTDNNGNNPIQSWRWPSPTEVIYANGSWSLYAYNHLGEVTAAVDEGGFETIYTYDAIGRRLVSRTYQTTTYTYGHLDVSDALGRVTSTQFATRVEGQP